MRVSSNGLIIASLLACTALPAGCAEGLDPVSCDESGLPCTVDEPPIDPAEPDPANGSLASVAYSEPEVNPASNQISDLATKHPRGIDEVNPLTTTEVAELLSIPRQVAYDRLRDGDYDRLQLGDHLVWGITPEQLSQLEDEFWGGQDNVSAPLPGVEREFRTFTTTSSTHNPVPQ